MRNLQSDVNYSMSMQMEGNFRSGMCHKVFFGCILIENL